MNKQKNIEKLIFETFDNSIKGTDIYNNNGSMWLIFTEERKWVFEYTNTKTLWYNYKHFTDILVLFGMELTEGAEYIKKWYEDKFIFNVGKNSERYINESLVDNIIDKGVKDTIDGLYRNNPSVEDTIQNGVKRALPESIPDSFGIKDAIQNGVKEINHVDVMKFFDNKMEEALQNGIKETKSMCGKRDGRVNNTIENGVKDTLDIYSRCEWEVKHAIKNGVRHVEDGDWLDQDDRIEEIIKNGVKS
jgi:hypothetical protein